MVVQSVSKIQPVKFQSIEDFLGYLPDHERKIVDLLRQIISQCIPDCRDKLAYSVPYYYRFSRICFIWPSSVPWGKVKLNGVQLGFCQGYLLPDDLQYLEKGSRKQVYTKTFFHLNDIKLDMVKTYLLSAVEVDEQMKK